MIEKLSTILKRKRNCLFTYTCEQLTFDIITTIFFLKYLSLINVKLLRVYFVSSITIGILKSILFFLFFSTCTTKGARYLQFTLMRLLLLFLKMKLPFIIFDKDYTG